MKNLVAWTALSIDYPPYISFNETEDGLVSVIVRSAPDGQICGTTSEIKLTKEVFAKIVQELK